MKIKVTMKDPDTLHDAISDAVADEVNSISGLSGDERDALIEMRREKAQEVAARWFRYGEYLTVEIDTEAGAAVVCSAERD